ncbi:MAG: hypothetical protein DMG41_13265 [Acidobacteria bacterium]|nr:MAG: hypothetical protein AUH13_00325 [Acidobacteria bacterium 13_2_20CM_58_27]PYT76305.1 MAG: hypothetical protein DMG42_05515 [Acidobacteriota bacterium]PYT87986.1 MAG: hypothetical protein DMG41_13265 [Acidobacteriota bacterium]
MGCSLVSQTAMRIFGVKMLRFSGGVKYGSQRCKSGDRDTQQRRGLPTSADLRSLPKRFLKPASAELQAV